MVDAATKRTRAPRRNIERELSTLKQYCEISIEVLEALITNPALSGCSDPAITDKLNEFNRGQLSALRSVLSRMNGGKS
jgi:hypothetical protein